MVEFVKAKRIQPNPREQFLIIRGLIAINRASMLWGLKTPAICLFFYRPGEEDEGRGASWLVHSKNNTRFICFQHRRCVFYIIFVAYFINKRRQVAEWLVRWMLTIGTWVRFPGPPKRF